MRVRAGWSLRRAHREQNKDALPLINGARLAVTFHNALKLRLRSTAAASRAARQPFSLANPDSIEATSKQHCSRQEVILMLAMSY